MGTRIARFVMIGAALCALGGSARAAGKVTICHRPPDNPANARTMSIGAPALPSHLAHGDFAGPCDRDCRTAPTLCDDQDPCTTDSCDSTAGGCTNRPIVCDDSIACTVDACTDGTCTYTPNDTLCDDENPDTADQCTATAETAPTGCTNSPTCACPAGVMDQACSTPPAELCQNLIDTVVTPALDCLPTCFADLATADCEWYAKLTSECGTDGWPPGNCTCFRECVARATVGCS